MFTADEAESRAQKGEAIILVRIETSPEDIHGMHAARGILTTRGGMTSHAAVVARGMGRPCVAGAGGISVDYGAQTLSAGGKTVRAGETITLDGAAGEVFVGTVAMIEPAMSDDFATLMGWADEARTHGGAGQRRDAAGCRDGEEVRRRRHRAVPHRAHVLRPGAHQRGAADDHGAGRGRPSHGAGACCCRSSATISTSCSASWATCRSPSGCSIRRCTSSCRTRDAELEDVAQALGANIEAMRRRAAELAEANPMLGHRGCRLGVTYPEIYEMQARAIFEGALAVAKETGKAPVPEIMIPLVGVKKELEITRAQVDRVAEEVFKAAGRRIEYSVGTMIELPRAAIVADKIAEVADFFSFGTNDLTQTVFGLSRDDAGKFLPQYVEQGILPKDPFVSIDVEGVGAMVRIAVRARAADEEPPEARHLRRARRRSGIDRVLPGGRAGLRVVQPVPRAGGAAGGRAGGAGRWRATGRRDRGPARGDQSAPADPLAVTGLARPVVPKTAIRRTCPGALGGRPTAIPSLPNSTDPGYIGGIRRGRWSRMPTPGSDKCRNRTETMNMPSERGLITFGSARVVPKGRPKLIGCWPLAISPAMNPQTSSWTTKRRFSQAILMQICRRC